MNNDISQINHFIGTMTTIKDQVLELFHKLPDAESNMLYELRGNRLWIIFNRPKRFNAFTFDMYDKLAKKIIEANNDERVKFIIFSGNGGNFSSGNDLNNFALGSTLKATTEQISQATADIIYDMTNALIHSKKPLFAITEGKVIGFSLTQLPFHDKVFAVQGSEYSAPLVKLAQGPELCSSYTFPKRFGQSLGEQIIVSGRKLDSHFLEKYGLATVCKSRLDAEQHLEKHLTELDELNWPSYLAARNLFRDVDRNALEKTNRRQCDNLVKRWSDPNLIPYLKDYLSKAKTKPKL